MKKKASSAVAVGMVVRRMKTRQKTWCVDGVVGGASRQGVDWAEERDWSVEIVARQRDERGDMRTYKGAYFHRREGVGFMVWRCGSCGYT